MPDETPARKIELIPLGDKHLTPDRPSVSFRIKMCPANALPQELTFKITNAKGIETACATYTVQDDVITVTGHGDGEVWLRACCCNGYDHVRLISQQDIRIDGMGQPNIDPYSFVSAGLFDVHQGEITNGNEQGIAFAREGMSLVGFNNVDFGPVGSDEIYLPIFALDANLHNLHLWDGVPGDGGRLIAVLPYQKPSRWNVYQPETYRLPERLTGLRTICFSLTEKAHLKGFSFTRQSRAWLALSALDADAVYGDSFVRSDDAVLDIGNNVSLIYENMDFAEAARAKICIDGRTPLNENPITLRFQNEAGESLTSLAQFKGVKRGKQVFETDVLPGLCTVSFVFLPGCQFDFYSFQFEQM